MQAEFSSKFWTISGGLILLVAVGLILWRVLPRPIVVGKDSPEKAGEIQVPETAPTISGQQVAGDIAARPVVGVIVENHSDSRPQSGLSEAEVVYEMVAEGGITRYLALFQKDVQSIGPVRSARDYFAELANSWGGVFAHVGGSPEVISNLKSGLYSKLVDVDEFYNADYFERVKTRSAPHNTYTSTAKLLSYLESRNKLNTVDVAPFAISDTVPPSSERATNISLNFSLPSYKAVFKFDATTGTYPRSIAGKADIDAANKKQLAPKTVIVQLTDIAEIPGDEKLRVDIRTSGSGKAYIFQNGGMVHGTWKREIGKPTFYFGDNGESVTIAPGQLWIALLSGADAAAVTWFDSSAQP